MNLITLARRAVGATRGRPTWTEGRPKRKGDRRSPLRVLIGVMFLISGCAGTLAVGVEQTPTPDLRPQATLQALQQENERLAAALATASAPSPVPRAPLGRVAYIRGGDLWLAVLPEGPHQRLTLDGHNREPRLSSKGEWIAYRRDRTVLVEREKPCEEPLHEGEPPCRESVSTFQQQVWLARRNGEDQHVINRGFTVERFAWSPTNDLLAYITDAGHLQTLDPATDIGSRLVTAQGSGRVNALAWSADGSRIAYEWITDEQSGTGVGREDGVWVVPAAGGSSVRLTHASPAGLAGWRDNEHVLFWQNPEEPTQPQDSVWLYSVALTQLGQAAPEAQVVQGEPMLQRPDSVAVAGSATRPVAATIGAGLPTWTNKRIVAGTFETQPDLAAISPAWSSDGRRLAFVAMPDAPGLTLGENAVSALLARHLYVANIDTGLVQQLTAEGPYRDERPQWALQGTHLLFARVTREGQASLWLLPLAGGSPILVVDELTPAPDPVGTYGYIDWGQHFDWWRG